jgi:hypothetical protein
MGPSDHGDERSPRPQGRRRGEHQAAGGLAVGRHARAGWLAAGGTRGRARTGEPGSLRPRAGVALREAGRAALGDGRFVTGDPGGAGARPGARPARPWGAAPGGGRVARARP